MTIKIHFCVQKMKTWKQNLIPFYWQPRGWMQFSKHYAKSTTSLWWTAKEFRCRKLQMRDWRTSVRAVCRNIALDNRGIQFSVGGKRFFSPPKRQYRLWGTPSLLLNEQPRLFSPGVKRPKRDDDHSPPTSTKIKCSYTSIAPYAVVACRRTMLALANCIQIDS